MLNCLTQRRPVSTSVTGKDPNLQCSCHCGDLGECLIPVVLVYCSIPVFFPGSYFFYFGSTIAVRRLVEQLHHSRSPICQLSFSLWNHYIKLSLWCYALYKVRLMNACYYRCVMSCALQINWHKSHTWCIGSVPCLVVVCAWHSNKSMSFVYPEIGINEWVCTIR